mmetsp:Transcript_54846/g.129361  ORF Transcript_54846/g.129361 Transcript_54846/m.129361 type:complete len:215 (+) Transcript_54846:217-861(+)
MLPFHRHRVAVDKHARDVDSHAADQSVEGRDLEGGAEHDEAIALCDVGLRALCEARVDRLAVHDDVRPDDLAMLCEEGVLLVLAQSFLELIQGIRLLAVIPRHCLDRPVYFNKLLRRDPCLALQSIDILCVNTQQHPLLFQLAKELVRPGRLNVLQVCVHVLHPRQEVVRILPEVGDRKEILRWSVVGSQLRMLLAHALEDPARAPIVWDSRRR